MTVKERILATYLVPVVVLDNAAAAVDTAGAMLAGGVDIMEITLRTPAGLDAIARVAERCPDVLVGAGTVLTLAQCKEAVARGAKFVVSPGFDPTVVEFCLANGVQPMPGCVTPTEITTAMNAGLDTVKFFPANIYGGMKAIKALGGPFPNIQFVPTGGVNNDNLAEYIAPSVLAVGGGWLCDRKAVNAGDWGTITAVCAGAVAIVKENRS